MPRSARRRRRITITVLVATAVATIAVASAAVSLAVPPVRPGPGEEAPPTVAGPATVDVTSATPADGASHPSGGAGDPATTAPCRPTARACVQLATQHVWLLADGRVVRDGFVSSGTTDMQTPTGIFRVQYKDATHRSGEYDTAMPYSVFFDTRGDALHEGSLALQSRGCVHLEHDDAVAFFDALDPGDEVQILP